jgi:hypothetical protein
MPIEPKDDRDDLAQLEAEYEAECQAEQTEGGNTSAFHASQKIVADHIKETALEPPKPKPISFDEHGLMSGSDAAEELRIARWLLSTGACPPTYRTAEQVVLGIQLVKSFGLNVMASLRYTAYINDILCMWGDLPLSIVERSGNLEWIKEYRVVKGPDGKPVQQSHEDATMFEPVAGSVCIVKHKEKPEPRAAFYTVEKATAAGLLPGHPKSAWGKHPDRMLQLRARAMALRDSFSGELLGAAIKEYDVDGIDDRKALEQPAVAKEINALFETED